MKHSTGPEEAETVKVVKNGEGGPEREWNPATRYGGPSKRERRWDDRERPTVRAAGRDRGNATYREVDSSGWERRRGSKSYGRMSGAKGRQSFADLGGQTGARTRSSRVRARSWVVSRLYWQQQNRRPDGRRQGPGREAKDVGGAAKPNERLRRVVRHRRPTQHRGGPGSEGPGTQRRETGRWQHRNGPERATRRPNLQRTRAEILRKETRGLNGIW